MKEYLIIKGMMLIKGKLIKVTLIDDPEIKEKRQFDTKILKDVGEAFQFTKQMLDAEIDHERIIFMSVEEWKKNNYNFASKITLDTNPTEV